MGELRTAEDRPWTLGRYKRKKKQCECNLTSQILCSDLISKCCMGLKVRTRTHTLASKALLSLLKGIWYYMSLMILSPELIIPCLLCLFFFHWDYTVSSAWTLILFLLHNTSLRSFSPCLCIWIYLFSFRLLSSSPVFVLQNISTNVCFLCFLFYFLLQHLQEHSSLCLSANFITILMD